MEITVNEHDKQGRFEELFMPHLDAAYNLAYWMISNAHDAEDVVQDSFLRAFKFFDRFRGDNSRSWLLAIVRNVSYDWLRAKGNNEEVIEFDEELHGPEEIVSEPLAVPAMRDAEQEVVREVIEELPACFREVTILRELEGMSYKEISEVTQTPIGTVMSRLARARNQLQRCLPARLRQEQSS
jgi:RNA polymerase sigma-70 factor (ECF subfamily)